MSRARAGLLIAVLVLTGGSAVRALSLAGLVPQRTFVVVLAVALASLACAVAGAYLAMTRGRLASLPLAAGLVIYSICIGIHVEDGLTVSWQAVSLYLALGRGDSEIGVNLVGIALLAWYARLRRAPGNGDGVEDRLAFAAGTPPAGRSPAEGL